MAQKMFDLVKFTCFVSLMTLVRIPRTCISNIYNLSVTGEMGGGDKRISRSVGASYPGLFSTA